MNLNTLAVALQGIGFGAFVVAVAGLSAADVQGGALDYQPRRIVRRKKENDEALFLMGVL